MNLEDLNLSCITKKNSISEIGNRDLQQLEWRFSDCLKLNHNSINNSNNKEVIQFLIKQVSYKHLNKKKNVLEEICQNRQRDSFGKKKNFRKNSYFDEQILNELQEKNKQLEQINENNQLKLQALDKENENLRIQLLAKEQKKPKQVINNSQKTVSSQPLIDVGSQKSITQLQHIPESEAEETPINRPTMKGYQRNTISFTQYSAGLENSEEGLKKKKKSEQKIKMILNNGGLSSLGSTVRRLFISNTIQNTPSSQAANQINKNLLTAFQSEGKYQSISSKIDSNLEKKMYHEEIVKRNKQKFNNQQQTLNIGANQNDSNDLTIISLSSCQNSNIKPINLQLNNDDTISKISCYEDFNHIFNSYNQNQNVKLKYYSYLLEESYFQHEKFAQYIQHSLSNEQTEFDKCKYGDYQNSKLLELVEKQSKQIEKLKNENLQTNKKQEQLSQLVLLYQDQIVKMNSSNEAIYSQVKQMQDELSTIDLFFQFEDDLDLIHLRDMQLISKLESVPSLFQDGVERIKMNVNQLKNRISELDKIIRQNKEEFHQCLSTLNQRLQNQLNISNNLNTSANQNCKQRQINSEDLQNMYQILSQTIDTTIQVMIELQQESQKQKDTIKQKSIEKQNLEKQFKQINYSQKKEQEEIMQKLHEQFKKLTDQQQKLEQQLFDVKLDKKRIIYQKLQKKLQCKFMHSTDCIEQEIFYSFERTKIQQGIKSDKNFNFEEAIKEFNSVTNQKTDYVTSFNLKNVARSLFLIVKNQHENLQEYKRTLLEFMKLFEWLEVCVEVDSQGDLHINESFLSEIELPELVEWAGVFKRNIEISIQQLIKRQVDSKIGLSQKEKNQLKKLIYTGNYSDYFSLLIQNLTQIKI
ncbi:hypothetical protein ABPG72_000974 [Tetrahymena utriculariae]